MDVQSRFPPRPVRITAVVLLAIFVSGVLVYLNVLPADDLHLVPFLLVGYLALELLVPYLIRGSRPNDAKGERR